MLVRYNLGSDTISVTPRLGGNTWHDREKVIRDKFTTNIFK